MCIFEGGFTLEIYTHRIMRDFVVVKIMGDSIWHFLSQQFLVFSVHFVAKDLAN